MKIGYYIDTYTYKKSKAISILSNIKGEELRKELIKNFQEETHTFIDPVKQLEHEDREKEWDLER